MMGKEREGEVNRKRDRWGRIEKEKPTLVGMRRTTNEEMITKQGNVGQDRYAEALFYEMGRSNSKGKKEDCTNY
jgi:hypothetical protein